MSSGLKKSQLDNELFLTILRILYKKTTFTKQSYLGVIRKYTNE